MARGRKPGTRPKGDRSAITVRVPFDHRDVYVQAAARSGMPLSDYVGAVLARAHELAEPAYVHRNKAQQELPLGA